MLAVMVKEGENGSPFAFLEKYLPVKPDESKEVNAEFDPNKNLPKNKDFFHYKGSLTTPPCTEGVNRIVFKQPITNS